jgi:predicted HAD superfamily hydrolase
VNLQDAGRDDVFFRINIVEKCTGTLYISQDQKGILQFGMGHCVDDLSQKLLAYILVQNYTPGGVSSNFL